MVLALTFFTNLILATATLARPSLEERVARRQGGTLQPVEGPEGLTNQTNVAYSKNWAGAVFNSPAGTYKAVTATFVVPKPKIPRGGSAGGTYSASAWVGIDGNTCQSAILQTGVDFTVHGNKVTYDAWYEWWPAHAYDFSGISFKAGDVVQLTVNAKTTKSGTAEIKNLTTGKKVTKSLTSSHALCKKNAEWIVEDFEQGNSLVPFANFGTVKFLGAKATKGSSTVGPSGAILIDIKQNGKVLTSVSKTSSSVTVKHV